MNIIDIHKLYINECKQQICSDTRKMSPGSLYVALKGDQFDGNSFAIKALELGCNYALIDDLSINHDRCIYVKDVQKTLTELAQYHRRQFNIPVIGLTGSNGKTTTKELLHAALSEQKEVISTLGNLNNHIGVPLTLLRINRDTDIAVIEMGANHIGDIRDLCEIAEPTHGIITNIGKAHLGYFGGIGGVIQAKTEMFEYIKRTNGQVFVNASDATLMKYSEGIQRTLYGPSTNGVFKVSSLHTIPYVSLMWAQATKVVTKLTGEYNIDNIACALCVATHFDVVKQSIVKGIQEYTPQNSRSEMLITKSGNIVIKDFYNANPTSMKAAITNAKNISKGKRLIYILADMFELDEYSHVEHQDLAHYAESMKPDGLYLIGKDFMKVHASYAKKFKTTQEAISELKRVNISNSVLLIKGSNGMNLKQLFEELEF